METPMNNEPEVTAPTPKEPEVIVDLREWVAQYADPVKLMSLDTDDTMRETRYRTWVDMLAAYDALKAERGAAVRAATAWKRSAKLNKELWNDEKEVHAQRCHDVDTLRAERDAAVQEAESLSADVVKLVNETASLRARLAAAEQTIDGVCEATKHLVRDGEAQELAEHVNSIVARLAACEKIVKAAKLFLTIYDHETDMPNECAAAIEELRTAVATAQGDK